MSLHEVFVKLRNDQLKLAEDYEAVKSYEMAYVALWSVTEHMVKKIDELRKRKELREKILVWNNYFETKTLGQRPEPIKSFDLSVKTIPDVKTILNFLGNAPALKKLLNTDPKFGSTKYREKRNAIAHNAEKFKDVSLYYSDYKITALAAIAELEEKIKGMT